MDDGEQIRALVHAYAELLDGGDLDGLAALFAHATWRSQGRSEIARGSEQVRRRYDGVILYDGRPLTKHAITNLTVVSDGSDVATARCSFTVFQATPSLPLQPILAGSYHDEFARIDRAWQFRDRLIIVDLVGDLSRHMRAGNNTA
jgi:3-phenylpropionate/cinnamic acid dioxygenase small subunit